MTRFQCEDRGQAIVLISIVLGVLILGIGIAVDVGQLYVARRAAQTAADSAAWAGAVVVYNAGAAGFSVATATSARTAAIADAALNSYTIVASDVLIPPTSGPANGDQGFVEVNITTSVSTFFFPGPRTVKVRGVAGSSRTGLGEALHITSPTLANAVNLIGTGSMFLTGGSVFVRSNHASSINIASPTGGFGITTPVGSPTRTRGGIATGDSVKITPAATTGAADIVDPLANLPVPTSTGCTPATPLVACTAFPGPNTYNANTTINPGIYTTGITVTGGTVTMNAGTYILRGGGLTVSGGSLTVAANAGVLIYNANSTFPVAGGSCGAISFTTTGSITLRPRTTGSFAGLTIFQDLVCTNRMIWGGSGAGSTRSFTGTVYMRAGTAPALRLNGTGAAATIAMTGQIIVPTYEQNNVRLDLTYDRAWVIGALAPVLIE